MSARDSMAPVILGSVLLFLLFQPRRSSATEPAPSPPAPAPSPKIDPDNPPDIELPPGPPPEPDEIWPKPPPPPILPPTKYVNAIPGHRYHVVVDVKPDDNVGFFSALKEIATSDLFAGRFSNFKLGTWRSYERPGVGDVTQVEFDVTATVELSLPLDTQIPIRGVGQAWVVSARDVTATQ